MKSLLLAIAASAAVALWTHTSRAETVQAPVLEAPTITSVMSGN